MNASIKQLIKLWMFWICYFVAARFLFVAINFNAVSDFSFSAILMSFWKGLKLDLSMIGYISILPGLIAIGYNISPRKFWYKTLRMYNFIIIALASPLILSDAVMYSHWGTKLDIDALKFLKTPAVILSNLTFTQTISILITHIGLIALSIYVFKKFVKPAKLAYKYSIKNLILSLAFTINLIWPIRGGFDIYPKLQLGIPIKISTAYFHHDIFYNHAAYNSIWHLGNILNHLDNSELHLPIDSTLIPSNPITFKNKNSHNFTILTKQPKHVVLIVLESFTAKIIGALSGDSLVTPSLNKAIKQGVSFSNFYGCGTRSDKGITSILSGFPPLLKRPIADPDKFKNLSYFPNTLRQYGFHNTMIHGGDLNFGNFNLLFTTAGFHDIIGRKDFGEKELIQKWGAPDEFTFKKLLSTVLNQEDSSFSMLFTLSSHNPFDVPGKKHFEGDATYDKFANSAYYTDIQLGIFLEKLKSSNKWDDALVIITADHGVTISKDTKKPHYDPTQFHIPLVWSGGCVRQDTILQNYGDQTDIGYTLLKELGINSSPNYFEKDLKEQSWAFYNYNYGAALLTDSSKNIYNLNAQYFDGEETSSDSLNTLILLQQLQKDYNEL